MSDDRTTTIPDLPDWLTGLPSSARQFPGLTTRLLYGSGDGQALFVHAPTRTEVPMHVHRGQWGVVLTGSIELQIGDHRETYTSGQTYNIGSGVWHGGTVEEGTTLVEFFEDGEWHTPLQEA